MPHWYADVWRPGERRLARARERRLGAQERSAALGRKANTSNVSVPLGWVGQAVTADVAQTSCILTSIGGIERVIWSFFYRFSVACPFLSANIRDKSQEV